MQAHHCYVRVLTLVANVQIVKEAVEDWFVNKKPHQFPTVLFKVLARLDEERQRWLAKNPDVGSEIIIEAWVSPKANECTYTVQSQVYPAAQSSPEQLQQILRDLIFFFGDERSGRRE